MVQKLLSGILVSLSICFGTAALAFAENPLDETLSTLEQWVETERRIVEAEADWETEKAAIENLIDVYQREIEALSKVILEAEKDTSAAETRRAELLELDAEVKEIEGVVSKQLAESESKLKELEQQLHGIVQEEISSLFSMLPEDGQTKNIALGQRIQTIAAILTHVQKFDQTVTVADGFREFEEGTTVQTEKIYLGLGAAYFVDLNGEHAGYGVLKEDGWDWVDDDALAPTIRQLIDIYRGASQATYVSVPVQVK